MSEDLELRRIQADAFVRIARIRRALERRTEALLADAGIDDITPAQTHTLMVLFHAREPMNACSVAEALGVSQVTVSRFLKALAAAGWVQRERDPNDSRAYLLRPTPKAYDGLRRLVHVFNAVHDEAFAGFSPDEIRRSAAWVERIDRNLDGERSDDGAEKATDNGG